MKPTEYEKNVLITESNNFTAIKGRVDDRMVRLLHAGLGFSSELQELVEASNPENEYDWANISEEGGDLLWYCGVAVNALEFDHNEISSGENTNQDVLWKQFVSSLEEVVSSITWSVGKYNDLLKKHLMYGKPLNTEELKKSLQAICTAVSGLALVCGTTIDQMRDTNIAKLKARYGDKFTEAAALNRNLEVERKILEDGVK